MTHDPLPFTDTSGRHIFRDYRVHVPRLLFFTVLSLFWGGVALFFTAAFLFTGVRTPHPDWRVALLFNAIFTLPIGALGLFLMSRYVMLFGRRIMLDNTGLILWTYRGRMAVAWDDVTALYVGAYPRRHILVRGALLIFCTIPYLLSRLESRRRYTLCLRDGQRLGIPSAFPGKDALACVVGSAIAQDRLPSMLRRYHEGEGCDFGAVRVATDGLYMRKRVLPWEEFDHVTWNRARLYVFRRGKRRSWTSVSLTTLPNPWLFLALVWRISAETRHA